MKKFAVVLAGCGVFDGSEIHEAVLALYAIKKNGADYQIFAPNIPQHHVLNHLTGQEMPETRNVLVESARIARGKIRPLNELRVSDFDAVLFPGGFGVAKNLCNYAFKGVNFEVNAEVARVIGETVKEKIPLGALCISPVMLARVLGDVRLTLGNNPKDADKLEQMGAQAVLTTHGEVVTDERYKIFTTPCYMLDADIVQVVEGAENIVKAMLKNQG